MSDLDREVAEKVMGWHSEYRTGLWTVTECNEGTANVWVDAKGDWKANMDDEGGYVWGGVFRPSSNIADAWLVLETHKGAIELFKTDFDEWGCNLLGDQMIFGGYHKTPMEAICHALLKKAEDAEEPERQEE